MTLYDTPTPAFFSFVLWPNKVPHWFQMCTKQSLSIVGMCEQDFETPGPWDDTYVWHFTSAIHGLSWYLAVAMSFKDFKWEVVFVSHPNNYYSNWCPQVNCLSRLGLWIRAWIRISSSLFRAPDLWTVTFSVFRARMTIDYSIGISMQF